MIVTFISFFSGCDDVAAGFSLGFLFCFFMYSNKISYAFMRVGWEDTDAQDLSIYSRTSQTQTQEPAKPQAHDERRAGGTYRHEGDMR